MQNPLISGKTYQSLDMKHEKRVSKVRSYKHKLLYVMGGSLAAYESLTQPALAR